MSIETLVAYVAGDVTDLHVRVLARLAHNLRGEGWTCGDPVVVEHLDTGSATPREDVPVRALGLALAVAPDGVVPATPGSELRSFVDTLTGVSAAHGITFELELDGRHVGTISDGRASRALLLGLIEPW